MTASDERPRPCARCVASALVGVIVAGVMLALTVRLIGALAPRLRRRGPGGGT